jgi:zinc and cadmium transporter
VTLLWFYALVSVVIVSLISLIGAITISLDDRRLKYLIGLMMGLAVGAMLGDAFIHLLPEAFARYRSSVWPGIYAMLGILIFFLLEKFLHWLPERSIRNIRPFGYLNLVADGFHNLIDGMVIGASYLVSTHVGIATTLAVVFHEIPQELGDFGVLLDAGFSKWAALFFNFLSACTAIVGTIVVLVLGTRVEQVNSLMLPFTAGGFVYLAGADLIPELNKESDVFRSFAQFGAIVFGVGIMILIKELE